MQPDNYTEIVIICKGRNAFLMQKKKKAEILKQNFSNVFQSESD